MIIYQFERIGMIRIYIYIYIYSHEYKECVVIVINNQVGVRID